MTNAQKFFSESFRRVVYVSHPNRLYFDLVEAEDPDVVIFETVERRLCLAPDEPSLADFRGIFGDLLLEDTDAVAEQVSSRSALLNDDPVAALASNDAVLGRVQPTARLMAYRARVLAELGEVEAALEALRTAATLDPEDAPVLHELARRLRQHGLYAESLAAARRATEIEPRHEAFWTIAITAALEAGQTDEAHRLAQQATEHHHTANVFYAYSSALVAAGHPEAALAPARRAVELEPDVPLYLRQLLSVLVRTRAWLPAARCLERLRVLDPETPLLDSYALLVERNLAEDVAPGLS